MFPISVHTLARFLAHLSLQSYSGSSIATIMSGIAFLHKLVGGVNPCDSFIIKKMLKGAMRLKPSNEQRLPITKDMLAKIIGMVGNVTETVYDEKMFKAIFSLMFHALLRVSEVARVSARTNHLIKYEHVNISKTAVVITLHSYKHKASSEPICLHVDALNNESTCPVKLMNDYIGHRGCEKGALFRNRDKSAVRRGQICNILRDTLDACAFDSDRINTHSLRIGGCSHGAMNNVDSKQLQQWGRWRSNNAMESYIRIDWRPFSM